MNSQQLATHIAASLEAHEGVRINSLEVLRFTPSVLVTRAFLGIKADDGKQFLVTVEEA